MSTRAQESQLIELKDTIAQLNITIKTLTDTIARQELENKNLQAELDWFKQKLFGTSSEKRKTPFPGQLSLFEENEEEKPIEPIDPETIPASDSKKPRKPRRTLAQQFAAIPTRQVVVDTLSLEDKTCPVCGTGMVPIGTEIIRTEIVYTRPKIERIEYIATTYACPLCKDSLEPQFVKDNGTPALIPGSYLSESLLSYIAYRKYGLFVPLRRQEKDFLQEGAPISATTMASGLITAGNTYLQPMYDYFRKKLLARRFLMMDETPVQVLKEKERRAESKSYFWLIRTGEDRENPIILYNYTPTRAGENAKEFLKGISPGYYLMADGYQGYGKLPEAKRCCCYAHIRRYFLEAIPKGHESDYNHPAVQGVLYCDKLFAYERTYKEKALSVKRVTMRRQKDQKPIVEAFLAWANQTDPKDNAKLKKALAYVVNRKDSLFTYLEDGRCSLSNNLSENAIRPVTLGRKNWLFSDTPEGAHANVLYLTMAAMAKSYSLNLESYLSYIFTKRPNESMSVEELDVLAPWNPEVQKVCGIRSTVETASK
ncbi:MAG: IS66 family transposase [Eubacteriales bacterium]|nr:IS66 family transposase [Eubacteriales bacterium]